MKYCGKCKQTLSIEKFQINRRRKDGLQSYCKPCMQARLREHYQNNKERYKQNTKASKLRRLPEFQKWIRELKSNPCVDCGRTFHYCAMDFDHIEGKKNFGIARSFGLDKSRIKKELAKCELVCAVCHRIRTYNRRHHIKTLIVDNNG